MGNLPSIPGEPSAVRAAADRIKKNKDEERSRSRSISNLGAEPDVFGKFPKDYQIAGLRRSKLHRNVHRLKLANNKTKRVRSFKSRTLKVRR